MNATDQHRLVDGRGRHVPRSTSGPVGPTAWPPSPKREAAITAGALILILGGVAAGLWMTPESRQLSAEAAQARRHVIEIVNQPVTRLPRSAEAGEFSPGWFHPGAIRPDFSKVDVRDTQEFPYDRYSYVTSDLNPSEMFIGKELEFNSMTKYFYVDRTLPKKRLSQSEMLEINHLYRIMASEEHASFIRWAVLIGLATTLFLLAAAVQLLFPRRHPEEQPLSLQS